MTAEGSLRRRLTGVIVGLVAAVLVAFGVLLYVGVNRAAWRQHDVGLEARARALAASAEHDDEGYELVLPPEHAGETPVYLEAWRPDGTVLSRSASLRGADLDRTFATADVVFQDQPLPDGRAGRAVALRFAPREEDSATRPPASLLLVVAEGTDDVDAAVAIVRSWFVLLGVLALAAVALVTTWSLARGLRPLARLAAEIEQIDDSRLAQRLSTADQPAELAVPVRKLNELLARLAASFARERQFTADVSHELRTPIAGLRTLLEVTALAERPGAEYREALAEALAIVLQLGTITENLLTLARLDGGQVDLEVSDVPLRALVAECWRSQAALAGSRALVFRNLVPAGATLRTDREKLRIVVANLLANAAEYTEPGGWIEVTARAPATLEVADSGPPIPADQLARIFDRLWRGDAARTGGVHCGIGLSLSRALCTALALSLDVHATTDRMAFRIVRSDALRRGHDD